MAHRWTKEQKAKLAATMKQRHAEKMAAQDRQEPVKPRKVRRKKVRRTTKTVRSHHAVAEKRNRTLRHLTAELLRMLPDDKLIDMVRE